MFSYMRQGRGFYRNLARLALPIVLQNLITESLALADTFMVGTLGEGPLAGVALANIPVFVEQLMIFGLQSGSMVLISQFYGKGDRDSIDRVLGIGAYAAGGLTALFGCVMFFFPNWFMGLFGNDPAVVSIAARYGRIVAFSILFGGLSEVYIAAHRAMGNPKIGMYILAASMGINVCLNYVLIFGKLGLPAMGVEGAALATLIARGVQLLLALAHAVWNKRYRIQPPRFFRPGWAMVKKYVRYATPVILNETLWGLGTALYPTIMGHMDGSQAILAAYSLAGNVQNICIVAIFAVAGSTSIIIGQAIGSGERERVRELGRVLDTVAVLVGAVVGAIALPLIRFVVAPWLYPLFQLSDRAGEITTMMLTVTFVALPLRSFNTTNIVGVLRGGGDVTTAAVIDLAFLWVMAIPLSALAGLVLRLDIFWVYSVQALEQGVKSVVGWLRLRSGKWVRDVTVAA